MILTLFYVFAAAMMALLVFVMLKGLLNPSIRDETNHRDVNIGIARDRKSVIKDALSKGQIDQDTYDQELVDIESTLATELAEGPNSSQSRVMRGVGAVFIVGMVVGVSVVLYQRLGSSVVMSNAFLDQSGAVILANGATVDKRVAEALQAGTAPRDAANQVASAAQSQGNQDSLQTLLPQLEARLQENPDDLQGWTLLSRTYMNIQEYDKAEAALLEVNRLDEGNPEFIVMLAESVALQDNGNLMGEPQKLINEALAIDPENQRGQLLLGLSYQQSNQHDEAIEIFEELRSSPLLNQQGVENITAMINQSLVAKGEAPEAGSMPATALPSAQPSSQPSTQASSGSGASTDANAAADASGASLSVSASLSDAAAADVNDTDSVFIFARATAGPPMPLAVVRLTVADLPATVTLDDTQAMIPNMTLSTFPSVTVGVRVSPSGNAIAQSGDWFGETTEVLTGEPGELTVVVDQQTP